MSVRGNRQCSPNVPDYANCEAVAEGWRQSEAAAGTHNRVLSEVPVCETERQTLLRRILICQHLTM